LGVSKSTVIFHLNRLRRKGLVKRGQKDGKFQPYEVNWPTVVRFFLETVNPAFSFKPSRLEKFLNNKYIKELVEAGLKELADAHSPSYKRVRFGLKTYFKEFHEAIKQASLNIEGEGKDMEDFKELIESLREIVRLKNPGSFQWIRTLEKLDYITSVFPLKKPEGEGDEALRISEKH